MKERLVCLCLALAPTLCPALQITSYNVWADGRILVTSTPQEDLAGPRNEWTLVIFNPGKVDPESPARERTTTQDSPAGEAITASLSDVGLMTGLDSKAGLQLNSSASIAEASTDHPIHMGRKEIVPDADPVGVPDQGSTAALATIAFSGLVLLKRRTIGRAMSSSSL